MKKIFLPLLFFSAPILAAEPAKPLFDPDCWFGLYDDVYVIEIRLYEHDYIAYIVEHSKNCSCQNGDVNDDK